MKLIKNSALKIFLLLLKRISSPKASGKTGSIFLLVACFLFQVTSAVAGGLMPNAKGYRGDKPFKANSKKMVVSPSETRGQLTNEFIQRTTSLISKNNRLEYAAVANIVKGKVTNSKGDPLNGVSVTVKGTTAGTATDSKGNYSIDVPAYGTLVFSHVDFTTKEIPVNGRSSVDLMMEESTSSLGEVVVVGYGTQKKIDLTGAVAQIDGKEVANRSVANLGQALQGLIGNLNITTVGDPGGPGTPSTYNIRGITSINGGSPLFIVDGVAVDNLQDINPNDVATVTVLKDAASSAIYGARAPFGVIIITTKTGKKNEKIHLVYNDLFSTSKYTTIPKMANSVEYAVANNQASVNSGLALLFSDDLIAKLKQYMANPKSIPVTIPNPTNPNRWDWNNAVENNDWYAVYLKPESFNQTHNLSLSGGGEKTTYYLSGGFYDEGGQLRYGNDRYNRYNVSSNIHSEATKWLRMDFRMKFSNEMTNTPFPYSDLTGNWFHLAGTRHPNWPVINPDGYISQISALTFLTDAGRSITTVNNLTLTGAIELEPLKDWKINMDYTWNNNVGEISNHDAFIYAHAIDGSLYSVGHSQNAITKSTNSINYKSANIYSSYEKNLGKHFFKLLVGEQIEINNAFSLTGQRSDLITDDIPSLQIATGIQQASEAASSWATLGTFGRFNYSYDGKYLLELDGRNDGSSKFPPGNRFGLFPSVSAGYNISKESFWYPIKKYINNLKIRGSYGSLGNQDVANYLYLPIINIGTNLGYILNNERPDYINAPGLVSPTLTWETVKVTDIGADATFLNDRLSLSYDWYLRNTLNMLNSSSLLPAVLGAAIPVSNNASLQSRGFELNLGWRDKIGKDFSYNISIILSNYNSKITRMPSNPNKILSSYYQGENFGDIWGYKTAGLIQNQKEVDQMTTLTSGSSNFQKLWSLGDVMYTDLNGDGVLDKGTNTLASHGDLEVIGNSTPKYAYGINLSVSWKRFDFGMFWQGIGKRELWLNNTNFWGWLGGYGSAVWKSTLDYWTPNNTGAYWPKPYSSSQEAKNQQVQTRYLQNGAYARLKSLNIGYNIPFPKHFPIESIRAFANGENLLTFSKINKNFDPEVAGGSWGSGKEYPLLKTISIGVNVNF